MTASLPGAPSQIRSLRVGPGESNTFPSSEQDTHWPQQSMRVHTRGTLAECGARSTAAAQAAPALQLPLSHFSNWQKRIKARAPPHRRQLFESRIPDHPVQPHRPRGPPRPPRWSVPRFQTEAPPVPGTPEQPGTSHRVSAAPAGQWQSCPRNPWSLRRRHARLCAPASCWFPPSFRGEPQSPTLRRSAANRSEPPCWGPAA